MKDRPASKVNFPRKKPRTLQQGCPDVDDIEILSHFKGNGGGVICFLCMNATTAPPTAKNGAAIRGGDINSINCTETALLPKTRLGERRNAKTVL